MSSTISEIDTRHVDRCGEKNNKKISGLNCPNAGSDAPKKYNLNNASPPPPKDVQVRLRKNAAESDKLNFSERTNDSTIGPNKPKKDKQSPHWFQLFKCFY